MKHTPKLFNMWADWARKYKVKDQDLLRPFGMKNGPDWMRCEFLDLDDFYRFYTGLVEEE